MSNAAATGASSFTRRTLTADTAGALALLGAVPPSSVSPRSLLITLVGLSLTAAAGALAVCRLRAADHRPTAHRLSQASGPTT